MMGVLSDSLWALFSGSVAHRLRGNARAERVAEWRAQARLDLAPNLA